jgi:hypothetical protein
MTGPQPKDHRIDLKAAAAMTARHRGVATVAGARPAAEGDLGGMFSRDAVIKLLERTDAKFLRFYYGRNERGGRELILVASDADGNDLTGDDSALDTHFPCPPWCPGGGSALRG